MEEIKETKNTKCIYIDENGAFDFKKYRELNKDKIHDRMTKYREENKMLLREKSRVYYESKKDQINAKRRAKYAEKMGYSV